MSGLAHDVIELQCGPAAPILSKALRSMFFAPQGSQLIGGDFSNIEGRVNAWLANETWKLEAFKAYDRSEGPDLYKHIVSNIFGISIEAVTSLLRQRIGKPCELAFGFGGAIGAWLRFDANPSLMAGLVKERFYGTEQWLKATAQYDKALRTYGLSSDQWIAIKLVVNMWREANANITSAWWELGDAMIEAVDHPGTIVSVYSGRAKYLVAEGFLWCQLPSGKLLAYSRPRLVETKEDFVVDADGEVWPAEEFFLEQNSMPEGATLVEGRRRLQVEFDGTNPKTKAWGKQRIYGGSACNNIVQSTARELLRCAMHNVEDAGYPIVMHCHDELVAEVGQGFGSPEHFESLMSILPLWAEGLPLVAKAWRDSRYVK